VKLYRTRSGIVLESDHRWQWLPDTDWAALTTRADLLDYLRNQASSGPTAEPPIPEMLLVPIAMQEVWAAGVTYYRSRTARMEESQAAGGGTFYDRVYHADRPELFFKSSPHKVVGPGATVHIRKDSKWNVPEPELAVLLSSSGKITGYTVGNDMSSRDIEGENPLYLPQAKVYDRSCALGPCLLVQDQFPPPDTCIKLEVGRGGRTAFQDEITLAQMKRDPKLLVQYLFRENSFPYGCFLLTGTGIVPPDSFTLQPGDIVRISIDGIGTLENPVD
jgi:2-dehydro-3-deoxy-D-arabinonate dehydratase